MLGRPIREVLAMDAIEYQGYERLMLRGTMAERRLHYLLATIVSCITAFGGKPAKVEQVAPWLGSDEPPEDKQVEQVQQAILAGGISFGSDA